MGVNRITAEILQGFEAAHHWEDTSIDEKKLLMAEKDEDKDERIA